MDNKHRMDDLLSRHRLGELPAHLERQVLHLLSTQEGKRRLEELEAEDERILQELPPHRVAQEVHRRLDAVRGEVPARRNRSVPAWLAGSGMALALGGLAVVISLRIMAPPSSVTEPTSVTESAAAVSPTLTDSVSLRKPSTPTPSEAKAVTKAPGTQIAQGPVAVPAYDDEGLRTKGDLRRLRVHRVAAPNGTAVPLANGDTARFGDLLQVSLLAGPSTFAAVVSLDGAGHITRHIPEIGDSSVPVREAQEAPHSFQLDHTPGFERFVLIQSNHPFALSEAEAVVRRAGANSTLSAPVDWTVQSILVAKSEKLP